MSMATRSSDQEGQQNMDTTQIESKTLEPLSSHQGLEETEASSSAPSHSLSQSLVRRSTFDCPETWYYLGIHVIITEEGAVEQLPPHAWQATMVEDMICEMKPILTEVIVTGLG